MSNPYIPDEAPLAPGQQAQSSQVNTRYENTVAGFDKLPNPAVGKKGFSDPCPVGEPTDVDHAVTKQYADNLLAQNVADAQAAQLAAEAAETNAEASNSEAQQWAAHPEDDDLDGAPGQYSALHYAAKASKSEANAAASAGLVSPSFDSIAAMVAEVNLQIGQQVGVKEIGQYIIKDSGTGIPLANGNIAIPTGQINVKQFGAVGDGVTNDSTAFTDAITVAAGRTIYIPAGTYDVIGTFTGNFLSLGNVTITTGTVNYITEIAGDKLIYANNVEISKGSDSSLDNLAWGQGALSAGGLASTLNLAVGTNALQNLTTSGGGEDGSNTAVGRSAGQNLTTGYFNAFFGTTAGQKLTTAYNCSAFGRAAMGWRAQGFDNCAYGRESLYGEIGTASNLHTGRDNSAYGVSSLHDLVGGDRNSGFGRSAGAALISGNDNGFWGYSAGNLITTGSGNVIFGGYGGNSGGLDIRTSNNQIVMSDGTGAIRFNIDGSGNLFIGKTSAAIGSAGHELRANGTTYHTVDGNTVMLLNRTTDDGHLLRLYQDGTLEGQVSVSGTTVSYTGGHLARWSRLLDNSKPKLLKGTVLSNLDAMVNWDGEDNEQLNHVKVSDIEGDKDVAGVFVSWDVEQDEDGNIIENGYNDFHMAMTGDMVIRIASGISVSRGDLLMSAGGGTAKPQGDDIVRSKTIAKVTSAQISTTYPDGSYCVPCVLMAC